MMDKAPTSPCDPLLLLESHQRFGCSSGMSSMNRSTSPSQYWGVGHAGSCPLLHEAPFSWRLIWVSEITFLVPIFHCSLEVKNEFALTRKPKICQNAIKRLKLLIRQ